MTKATYIVRFDDVCPTMDWDVWDVIEKQMLKLDIKPIVAIIPDNKDGSLIIGDELDSFWERVRDWQSNGWSIAIHGFQHLYQTKNSGLIKLNNYSEFSGFTYERQREMLEKALKIFESHDIVPNLWVAPAHSFDQVTVSVLFDLGIRIISDGFYFRPVKNMNMIWIPQQIWRFRNFHGGTWTVCHHINGINDNQLEKICSDLNQYRNSISDLDNILKNRRINQINIIDKIFSFIWLNIVKLKRLFNRLKL
tara:strand:+ start:99 stop:851 length:753 start_codon:yes stop_codon:yes gene_type:complete